MHGFALFYVRKQLDRLKATQVKLDGYNYLGPLGLIKIERVKRARLSLGGKRSENEAFDRYNRGESFLNQH